MRQTEANCLKARSSGKPIELLVIVHPGSACGSADFNLGGTSAAQCERANLIREWEDWQHGVIVIDGELSDELPRYPTLDAALTGVLARAKQNGQISTRREGHDPAQVQVIECVLRELSLPKTRVLCQVTGAWYYGPGEGCVASVRDAIKQAGYRTTLSDSALRGD